MRRGRLQRGVSLIFHQDNAPPHGAHQTAQKIAEMGWEVFTHPPYSPDLAPSDFHLFGPLKESLGGIKFQNDDAIKQHALKFLHSTDKDFYAAGFTRLVDRWECCIELHGDYVKK